MRIVTVRIPQDPTKGSTVSVRGVRGEECRALTAGLERSLGVVVRDEPTPEMAQESEQEQQVKEGR